MSNGKCDQNVDYCYKISLKSANKNILKNV